MIIFPSRDFTTLLFEYLVRKMRPGEEEKLRDPLGNLPFDLSSEDLGEKNIKCVEVTQEVGEIIFVPSGWFHQVRNVEDTISINHNWFNGSNIMFVARALTTELR